MIELGSVETFIRADEYGFACLPPAYLERIKKMEEQLADLQKTLDNILELLTPPRADKGRIP